MGKVLLEVKDLRKYFHTGRGVLHAVDDVSFTIEEGKTLGIVGESGCGKSTTGRALLRLIEPTAGKVIFDGVDVTKASKAEMKELRKSMQIIFQDPFSSVNPRQTVQQTIEEALVMSGKYKNRDKRFQRILEIMDTIGIEERLINAYPHEMDGGHRQRVCIARALAMDPKFIVCDEPVSALDVSIQAQILNLLKKIQKEFNLTYVFITHDLSVVKHISHDIAVMYLGRMIEKAPAEELFANPIHPYTQALLSAIPVPRLHNRPERIVLKGEITSPINPEQRCRFANRCAFATESCYKAEPTLQEVSPGHFVACGKCNGNTPVTEK